MKRKMGVMFAAIAMLATQFAYSDLIAVSNLGNNLLATGIEFGSDMLAVQFTTGNSPGGYTLSSVTYKRGAGADPASVSAMLSLYSDAAGKPGASLLDMAIPSAPTPDSPVKVNGSVALGENTTYYLVFSAAGSGSEAFSTFDKGEVAGNPIEVGAGWNIGDARWTKPSAGGSWLKSTTDVMQVGIAVVPEPATASLVGGAGIALVALHRIRRRRQQQQSE